MPEANIGAENSVTFWRPMAVLAVATAIAGSVFLVADYRMEQADTQHDAFRVQSQTNCGDQPPVRPEPGITERVEEVAARFRKYSVWYECNKKWRNRLEFDQRESAADAVKFREVRDGARNITDILFAICVIALLGRWIWRYRRVD